MLEPSLMLTDPPPERRAPPRCLDSGQRLTEQTVSDRGTPPHARRVRDRLHNNVQLRVTPPALRRALGQQRSTWERNGAFHNRLAVSSTARPEQRRLDVSVARTAMPT